MIRISEGRMHTTGKKVMLGLPRQRVSIYHIHIRLVLGGDYKTCC